MSYEQDAKDGVFWIDLETYKKSFSETSISFNGANWASTKYMKTNDKTQKQNPGKMEGICGATCTHHTMTLTSDMEQTVYVSAQTWGRKAIPDVCEKKDNGLKHGI